MKLEWTLPAAQQLENIYHFYSQKSVEVATNIYNDIVDEADILVEFPNIAPIEPWLTDCVYVYRSLVVRKLFKIIYRIADETIFIVAVFDCRQNPTRMKTYVLED